MNTNTSTFLLLCTLAVCFSTPINQKKLQFKINPKLVDLMLIQLLNFKDEANLNDFADKIFPDIDQLIIHEGLDPYELPDIHEGFNYTLIITYDGELDMTSGWLNDLSLMHRGGDVIVSYDSDDTKKYLQITIPIAFEDLDFTYDYSAKIMDLGPTGGVEGKISDLEVEVVVGFDFENFTASLDSFYITNSGQISLKFSGNSLADWLLNILLDVATTALHEIILLVMEVVVRNPLQQFVDDINQAINNTLNPTEASSAALHTFFRL